MESATGNDMGQNQVRHLRYIYSVPCQTIGPALQIGHTRAQAFINKLTCLQHSRPGPCTCSLRPPAIPTHHSGPHAAKNSKKLYGNLTRSL